MNYSNLFLPFYFLLVIGFGFVLRSFIVYRRTGINPLVLPQADDAYGYVGRAFKLLLLCLGFLVIFNAIEPLTSARFMPETSSIGLYLRVGGWALLLLSLVTMLLAQAEMKDAWRIGIDQARHTELAETGLFRFSRNPIFLSMRVMLLGLMLVLPSYWVLLIFIIGEVLMQVQVRLEEAHLSTLHGERYRGFCERVPRWL